MKKENKYALIGSGIGIVVGFLFQVILFGITTMEVFNFFFIPLYKIIPLNAIVPITFMFFGGIIGTIIGGLSGKE